MPPIKMLPTVKSGKIGQRLTLAYFHYAQNYLDNYLPALQGVKHPDFYD